ncbi:hypothetical protein Tco_1409636 [Tanacetum coccineum]
MTINSNLPPQIHKTQVESLKTENVKDENLHGIDNEFENHLDGTLYIRRRSRFPHFRDLRELIRNKSHKSDYFIHQGADKIYHNIKRILFKIIAEIGTVAYRLELPEKLSRVHSTFHVSKLKKCMADEPLAVPLDEIQVDDKLIFIKEPVEIMEREVKRLKQSHIPIVKVHWNSRRGPEFTWECEDQMQKKYLYLFTNSAPAAEVAS